MSGKIISISGLIGSGKDTVADYLVNSHSFRRESWAGTLKDAVAVVFGWDRTLLEGKTNESRKWREQADEWWSERLNENITPRRVLQEWGTDVCRDNFHDEIWIASLENKLRKTTDNVVISDSRFSNEIESVKRLGGITIRINRGITPEWVSEFLKDGPSMEFKKKYPTIHASEYSSVGLNYDYEISNDGTIDELYRKINDLLQYHQFSK
jgi:hypothetical protein